MEYESSNVIALSSDDHKLAALFFDRIIPFRPYMGDRYTNYVEEVPPSVQPEWMSDDVYNQICSYSMTNYAESFRVHVRKGIAVRRSTKGKHSIATILDKDWVNEQQKIPMTILPDSNGTKSSFTNTALFFASIYLKSKYNTISVPIFTGPSKPILSGGDHKRGFVEIVLDKLKVVDSSCAGWDQILQFKTDKESAIKLRNLRLFFHDKLSDKSPSYIKDKLDGTIDMYEAALKKHGFDLVESSLSTLIDSKSLVGASSLTVAALIAGMDQVAIITGLSGAIIETTKIIMKLIKSRYELKYYKNTHELAYLFEARKLFQD